MTHKLATFAGGCFWCMEPVFDSLPGVTGVRVGYIGGHVDSPSYEQVCQGNTGHAEAIEVQYNPEQISYQQLLEAFWQNIDPTVVDQQFCDKGSQYRTEIFYHDEKQRQLAEESKQALIDSGCFAQIATQVTIASTFYPAEDYHQSYYKACPLRYKSYRQASGRDEHLSRLWRKDPSC